ncbi:MAG TPA: hypothetical protein VK084_00855 [Chitinophagaceae bacterium]|nr:hypothetical protein [Chitinophagaceae bacterium]
MMENFVIYKGLQRPIVFKMLKGKYIYWGVGSLIAGLVIGGIIAATVSSIGGIIAAGAVTVPLFMYTLTKQKKGLDSKNINRGIFIVPPESSLSYFSMIMKKQKNEEAEI